MRIPRSGLAPALLVLAFAFGGSLLLESGQAGSHPDWRAPGPIGWSGSLGLSVAEQGNEALRQIRTESWEQFRRGPPLLPAPESEE